VRRRNGELWIDVVDSGVGIAPADHERIFDELYRVRVARTADRQGMGLGLAIVRRLARLLGHPFEFSSTQGRGSRFSVAVPHAVATFPLVVPPSDPRANTSSRLCGALIAVIDDEPSVLDGMRACLAQWGATVVPAACFEEIVDALGDVGRYPDLIVADYRLVSGELGTTVIERLRDEIGTDVPAVLVSGDARPKPSPTWA
jgi:CheY-like chemotaxis protein